MAQPALRPQIEAAFSSLGQEIARAFRSRGQGRAGHR